MRSSRDLFLRLLNTGNKTSLGTVLKADTTSAPRTFDAKASAPEVVCPITSRVSSLLIGREHVSSVLPFKLPALANTSSTRVQRTASNRAPHRALFRRVFPCTRLLQLLGQLLQLSPLREILKTSSCPAHANTIPSLLPINPDPRIPISIFSFNLFKINQRSRVHARARKYNDQENHLGSKSESPRARLRRRSLTNNETNSNASPAGPTAKSTTPMPP